MVKRISIIGAGSWGTTLAILLANKGFGTLLYVYEPDQYIQMKKDRENKKYLAGVKLPSSLQLTDNLQKTADFSDFLLLVVPSHVMRDMVSQLKQWDCSEKIFVNAAKGIENDTLKRMSQLITEVSGVSKSQVATLSGPSHAEEVSQGIATAIVSASSSIKTARLVRDVFMTETFRVYSSTDIIGVELGGALKNIIAIAAGIADGAGFGDNTKAALMTRGLVEMTRLGVAMGAQIATFPGLSGMGDLIVTCTSRHSRNRYVGEQIGKGSKLHQVLNNMVMVAEGVKTTRSVHQLKEHIPVETPICNEVYQVLFEDKDPKDAVKDLMTRDPKEETPL